METPRVTPLTYIVLEFCFAFALGSWIVGPPLFEPQAPEFHFTIIAFSTIILHNILKFKGSALFLLAWFLISVFFIFIWFRNPDPMFFLRQSLWFIILGAFILLTHVILETRLFYIIRVGATVIWVLALVAVYAAMTAMDIFVFHRLQWDDLTNWQFYAKNIAMSGGLIGLGIGLGYDLANALRGRPD